MPRAIGQIKKDSRSKLKKQRDFLESLIEFISITRAAKKARVGRQTIYDWLKADRDFKQAFENACEIATAKLEDEAIRRAYEGTLKPVYQGGAKVGTIREYSDTLLIVLLKARAPEKYKERFAGELSGQGGKDLFTNKSDEELKQLLAETLEKLK
jgi:predicted DNA-binding protein YlxM (UPF0122 family)